MAKPKDGIKVKFVRESAAPAASSRPPGPRLPVVGESHYRDNLRKIAGPGGTTGVNVNVTARLIAEPKNPHDPNAVRVDVNGRTVGYLGRDDAAELAPEMHRIHATSINIPAHISAGWDGADYSVNLLTDLDQLLASVATTKAGKSAGGSTGWGCLRVFAVFFVVVVVIGVVLRLMGYQPERSAPAPAPTAVEPGADSIQLPTPTPVPPVSPPTWLGAPGAVYPAGWTVLPLGDAGQAQIEYVFDPPVALAVVSTTVAAVLPPDAVLVETYSPTGRPEAIVQLYHSPGLAAAWPAEAFIGGEPGQFIVLTKVFDQRAAVVIVGPGNNP